jgi:hypothetical protein
MKKAADAETLRRQLVTAFDMGNVKAARSYLDSVEIRSLALSEVNIRPVVHEKFRGSWGCQQECRALRDCPILHGGAYCFYPQAYANFIALTTLAAIIATQTRIARGAVNSSD